MGAGGVCGRTIFADENRAELAFADHAALIKAECEDPELARDPSWRTLRTAGLCHFLAVFEAL
jgi:hypothetical protein